MPVSGSHDHATRDCVRGRAGLKCNAIQKRRAGGKALEAEKRRQKPALAGAENAGNGSEE